MGDSTCNWLALCSLILTVVSFFLLVTGAASESWVKPYVDPNDRWGYTYFKGRFTSAGKATYALNILAAISASFSIIFLSIYFCASQTGSTSQVIKKFKIVTGSLSVFGGLCGIICCVVFGVTFYQNGPYERDYSFLLTLIGSIILLIAGIVGYASKFKIKEPPSQIRPAGIMVNHQGVTYYVPAKAYPMGPTQASTTSAGTWGAGNDTMGQANPSWGQSNVTFGQPGNTFGTYATGNWQTNYSVPSS